MLFLGNKGHLLLFSNCFELQNQFVTLWLDGISVDCFNIVIVDNNGAEIGVYRSDGQLHFC